MPDHDLVCTQCNARFVFTESEQAFFEGRGLLPPKRCRACRRTRKQGRTTGVNIKPGQFPPEEEHSGTIRTQRVVRNGFQIRCADCGASAYVPFKPVEGRPVYCPACYQVRKGSVRQATDGDAIDESDEGIIE
jgi:CxxC-x17-CxxC domain-containing protein